MLIRCIVWRIRGMIESPVNVNLSKYCCKLAIAERSLHGLTALHPDISSVLCLE